MTEVDLEVLINLVQDQPILWDKTLEGYKDRIKTKNAWTEVLRQLQEGFDDMEEKEINDFAKSVMKKWGNIRDSFQRSKRKYKESMKSGNAKQPTKTYIYGQQLNFLKKTVELRHTDDSFHCEEDNSKTPEGPSNDSHQVSDSTIEKEVKSDRAFKKIQPTNKKRKPDPIELELLSAIKTKNRQSSFFDGIIPSLETFNDDEVVEFQLKVLQVVSDIKKRKRNSEDIDKTTNHIMSKPRNNIIAIQNKEYHTLQRVQDKGALPLHMDTTNSHLNLSAAQYFGQAGSFCTSAEFSDLSEHSSVSMDHFEF